MWTPWGGQGGGGAGGGGGGGGLDMAQMGRDGHVGGMREEGGISSMLPPNSRPDDALVLQQVSANACTLTLISTTVEPRYTGPVGKKILPETKERCLVAGFNCNEKRTVDSDFHKSFCYKIQQQNTSYLSNSILFQCS